MSKSFFSKSARGSESLPGGQPGNSESDELESYSQIQLCLLTAEVLREDYLD